MSRTLSLLAACWLGLASALAGQVAAGSARAAQLERDIILRPREAFLYVSLAREYEALGQPGTAESTLRAGLTAAANTRPVRAALIDLLIRSSRWVEAAPLAEPLAGDSSGRAILAMIRVNAGIMAYRSGDLATARTQWQKALEIDAGLPEAASNLSALFLEIGLRDSALVLADRALAHHPDNARLLALKAAASGGAAGLAAAVPAVRRMRAQRPKDQALGLELAALLDGAGDRLAAMALYDTLLSAPGASEAVHVAVANFELDGAQFNAAAALLEKGLEQFPRSGRLYLLLGEAETERKEWKKAAAAYRRASSLISNPEEAELPLLEVEVTAGDTVEALAIIRELAARPASRISLFAAAEHATAVKAPRVADSIYAGLLARDTLDIEALEAAGRVAEALHDTPRAVTLYRRALAQDSSGPIAPLALLRLAPVFPDSAPLLLKRAAWRGMEALQAAELQGAALVAGQTSARAMKRSQPMLQRQRELRTMVEATLDTMVFHTPWGPAELQQLQRAYRGSTLLERYAADLASRNGDDRVALTRYENLLRQTPTDAAIQGQRARLLERMGRQEEAAAGYARALDLVPEDEPTFRALLRLRERSGTLGDLLQQVRRIRIRIPESRKLGEHEVELLQRLDRVAEAQEVAKKLKEIKP